MAASRNSRDRDDRAVPARALDDPLTLACAARIVRAALARRALSDNQATAAGERRKADGSPPNAAVITPGDNGRNDSTILAT
jgi:hypothetical protein